MKPRLYAENTKVPAIQTRAEIERTLSRYGAKSFASYLEESRAVIMFEAKDRRLRFDLPLQKEGARENPADRDRRDQRNRQKWRALLLAIKSKLESVASGIETFEEAFLAHVIMPDGMTVGEHARPTIERAYQSGTMQPLLPAPKS